MTSDKTTGTPTGVSALIGYDAGGIAPRNGDAFERGFLDSSMIDLCVNNKRRAGEFTLLAPLSAPDMVSRRNLEFYASLRLTI